MKIFVLRHGITSEADTDESRELSNTGIAEVEAVVNRHLDELSNVRQVLCSPMPRVQATVNLALNLMGYEGDICLSDDFSTGSRLKQITRAMVGINPEDGDLLVSSHQSCTSILVLWLTAEDILIPNGSMLAIEVDEIAYGKGIVIWQDSNNINEIKRTVNFADQI